MDYRLPSCESSQRSTALNWGWWGARADDHYVLLVDVGGNRPGGLLRSHQRAQRTPLAGSHLDVKQPGPSQALEAGVDPDE
jgi:hypothetical protein